MPETRSCWLPRKSNYNISTYESKKVLSRAFSREVVPSRVLVALQRVLARVPARAAGIRAGVRFVAVVRFLVAAQVVRARKGPQAFVACEGPLVGGGCLGGRERGRWIRGEDVAGGRRPRSSRLLLLQHVLGSGVLSPVMLLVAGILRILTGRLRWVRVRGRLLGRMGLSTLGVAGPAAAGGRSGLPRYAAGASEVRLVLSVLLGSPTLSAAEHRQPESRRRQQWSVQYLCCCCDDEPDWFGGCDWFG